MPLIIGAALDRSNCTARVRCDVFRFNRSGLVCALHMGPRADISIYDIDICIWGRALIYEQSATLSCRDIPVGQIELFELFEQIELSGSRALPANLVRPCHPSDRRQMFEPCD